MKPIAIFYHCLTHLGNPPQLRPGAVGIIRDQMDVLMESGLLYECSEFIVGINGGSESREVANLLLPTKAQLVLHGLESRAENLTLVEIEKFVKTHPDYHVLYFHAKGCTHPPGDAMRDRWRECMMHHLVKNWRRCVADLDAGAESVGCHWMTGKQTPPGQSIWAGNFWFAKSDFLQTLPSIYARDRIKVSGIASLESRYESEVWIGNGPRLPRIKDYCPGWTPGKEHVSR